MEDDPIISQNIAKKLAKWGFLTEEVEDFADVEGTFLRYNPDLVILDITLPFYDGYMWCERIRKYSKVPVLYISSLSDGMNIIMAMNTGGDDFLVKPFDLDVMVAKVQALLRRAYDYKANQNYMEVRGVLLRLNDQTLLFDGKQIELTKNEYRILHTLFDHIGETVSRDELMWRLWETNEYIDDNTLTVNIARLRKKLEDCGVKDFIETKKGQGYIIHGN